MQHAFDFRVTPRMDEIDILASSLTLANQREQEARLFTKFQMMPASLVENRSFCDVCTLCCALSQKLCFFSLQGDFSHFSPAFVCFVKVDDRPSSSQSDRDPSRLAQVTTQLHPAATYQVHPSSTEAQGRISVLTTGSTAAMEALTLREMQLKASWPNKKVAASGQLKFSVKIDAQ